MKRGWACDRCFGDPSGELVVGYDPAETCGFEPRCEAYPVEVNALMAKRYRVVFADDDSIRVKAYTPPPSDGGVWSVRGADSGDCIWVNVASVQIIRDEGV